MVARAKVSLQKTRGGPPIVLRGARFQPSTILTEESQLFRQSPSYVCSLERFPPIRVHTIGGFVVFRTYQHFYWALL
jgi:hypothetical protein